MFDDEEPPQGPPSSGLLIGLAVVAAAIAVVALRPSDVSPNSLSASPPTSLIVPPEALTTTVPTRSLQTQVPGLRGALHFDVVTPDGRELWVWNAVDDAPTQVSVPGPVDISANRRWALSTTTNQADDGVVWLGPKLDMRPAAIVPGLTGAVWHRSQSEWIVVGSTNGTATTLEFWWFSGAKHEPQHSLVIAGEWEPVFLAETEGEEDFGGAPRVLGTAQLGLVSTNRIDGEYVSALIDPATGERLLELPGQMWATTGPPVIYGCRNIACTSATIGWLEDGELQQGVEGASIFPSSGSDLVAAITREGTSGMTTIHRTNGSAVIQVPFSSEVGGWSADGRFFVMPKTEFRFGDEPGLIFIDTVDETFHDVAVPGDAGWFVTNVWYGP